mgnify:CR=1 FL=1
MAINLSGKSDASIIASATRAGLATAPKDYSKTFQSVAASYEKTMGAQARMWDEIGKASVKIGKEVVQAAERFSLEKLYDINASQSFISDAEDIKTQLQKADLTRQERTELFAKRKKLFAEAEQIGSAVDNAAKNSANLDYNLIPFGDGIMVRAIIASNTSSPITEDGSTAKLVRNEKTKTLEYKMFKDGKPLLDPITNEPTTMSLDRFRNITTNYVKDVEGIVPTAFNNMGKNVLNSGKTFGGEFGDYHKGQVLTSLKNMTNTELGLLRAYKANYMGSSFFEDMTNPSELSATLFNSTLPKTEDGQLAAEGILANLEDTDNKKGIGQQELINQFSIISGTILSGEPGRKLFEEWVLDKSKKIYDKGGELFKDSSKTSSSSSGGGGGKNLERGGFLYGTNSTGYDSNHPDESKRDRVLNIGFDQMVRNRNALLPKNVTKGSEIQGEHYVYRFNGDTWQAFYNNEFVKNVKGSQVAQWEGLLSPSDVNAGRGIPMFDIGTTTAKQSIEEEERKPLTSGGIGINAIESNNVNNVRRSIQDVFIPQFAKDFNIGPVYEMITSVRDKGVVPRKVSNKIKITGPDGFEKIYQIGKNATSELADQMTKDILGVSDYRKQDPFLIKQ